MATDATWLHVPRPECGSWLLFRSGGQRDETSRGSGIESIGHRSFASSPESMFGWAVLVDATTRALARPARISGAETIIEGVDVAVRFTLHRRARTISTG